MKVRRIIIGLVVPLIFVIGTSFLSPADIATRTSPSEPRAEAALSTGNAANLDTVSSFTPVSPISSLEPIIKSKAWEKIESNSRRLTNNVWGAPEDETLTSGVYLNHDGGFGWDWNRPDPRTKPGQTCVKPIYPSVRCGGSPWDPSNSAYFPIRLRDIKSLKLDVTYNYPSTPTGSYNLAYDMFLSDTNQPASSPRPKPQAEVMIWLHSTFPQPPNTYRGDFTDGNNTYELYSFVMSDGRLYYSFAMKEPSKLKAQHTVDARRLMDNLPLDPGWYIHGVELGNEIVSGSGKIEISKFKVNLNSHES